MKFSVGVEYLLLPTQGKIIHLLVLRRRHLSIPQYREKLLGAKTCSAPFPPCSSSSLSKLFLNSGCLAQSRAQSLSSFSLAFEQVSLASHSVRLIPSSKPYNSSMNATPVIQLPSAVGCKAANQQFSFFFFFHSPRSLSLSHDGSGRKASCYALVYRE